jgi:hypothetical protein
MARWSVSPQLKGHATAYFVGFFVVLLFFFAPVLIELYYPQAAPVAAAFVWVTDTFGRGFGALTFFMALYMLCSLSNDAYQALARLCSTPTHGPIALENGTAEPAALHPAGTHIAADAPTAAESKPTLFNKIVSLFSSTYFFTRQCMIGDIVSLKRPLLENLGSVLVYILHGLEVVFAVFLVLVFVAWLKKKSSAAAAAEGGAAEQPTNQRVEVLDGVATVEKGYMEAEKV